MKFRARFRGLELNVPAYITELESFMQNKLEEIAREWLTAVTGRVPLWSGMARASLLSVSRIANGTVVLSPLKAKSRVPKGERLGDAEIKIETPIYEFIASTRVPHYVRQEHDNVGVSMSAPWKSFEAGNSAARALVLSIRLPVIEFRSRVIKRVG